MTAAWPTVAADECECEPICNPDDGGPWRDTTPAHRPVWNGYKWRCTCLRFTGLTLRDMRAHADKETYR